MPENEDAEKVFFMVEDQYIMSSMGGPVALNQVAVHEAMRLYGVEFPLDCFEKVVKLGRYFIRKQQDAMKEKRI